MPTRRELEDLGRALSTARTALSERNLDVAEEQLKLAEGLAQLPEHKGLVERLDKLREYVGEFWNAVRDALEALEPGQELTIGNTIVAVVEVTPERLVLRVAGQNRRYRLEELPSGLAIVLADRWFDASAPSTKVFKGAFMAVDRSYTPADARRLWDEAQRAGVPLDDLLPVLDDQYELASSAQPLTALPEGAALSEAEKRIKQQYAAELAEATTASARTSLAQALLKASPAAEGATERYALLRLALGLAAQAGQLELTGQIVDELAAAFAVDELETRTAALEALADSPIGSQSARSLFNSAMELGNQSGKAERLDLAERLAATAVKAARRSGDERMSRLAVQRKREVAMLRAQAQSATR